MIKDPSELPDRPAAEVRRLRPSRLELKRLRRALAIEPNLLPAEEGDAALVPPVQPDDHSVSMSLTTLKPVDPTE